MTTRTTSTLHVENVHRRSAEAFSVTSTIVDGRAEALLVDAQFALPAGRALLRRAHPRQRQGARRRSTSRTGTRTTTSACRPCSQSSRPRAWLRYPRTSSASRASVAAKVAQWKPARRRPDPGRARHPAAADRHARRRRRVPARDRPRRTGRRPRQLRRLRPVRRHPHRRRLPLQRRARLAPRRRAPKQWEEWLANVDRLEAVGASRVLLRVIAPPTRSTIPRVFASTREYIRDYAAALEASSTKQELLDPREREARGAARCRSCSRINAAAAFPDA